MSHNETGPGNVEGQIDDAIRRWLEQMARMRVVERELGKRLADCDTAHDAISLTGEWMARRIDSIIALQHRFIEIWLAARRDPIQASRLDPASPSMVLPCERAATALEATGDGRLARRSRL